MGCSLIHFVVGPENSVTYGVRGHHINLFLTEGF